MSTGRRAHCTFCSASLCALRRLKTANATVTGVDIMGLYERQEGRCAYCRQPLLGRFHVDHKTPLSRGGLHVIENLCCACPHCNIAKHDRTDAEFIAAHQLSDLADSTHAPAPAS